MDIDASSLRKILIVQQRPFGDVLLATAPLQALRDTFKNARIDFFVSAPYDAVVAGHPLLSKVIISSRKGPFFSYIFGRIRSIARVIRNRYDLVIDMQGNTGSAIIMMLCFARYRLGWDYTRSGRFFCNIRATKGPDRYSGNRNFDMLLPLGINERPYSLHVTITPESTAYISNWLADHHIAKNRYICLSTRSVNPENMWPDAWYLQLIRLIARNTTCRCILTYAPDEEAAVRSLADTSEGDAIAGPRTDFNQVAALLSFCKALICLDGGINHLAAATKTPTIALFGRGNAQWWSPQGVFPHHYHIMHHHPREDTTHGITPEEVLSRLQELFIEIDGGAVENSTNRTSGS